MQPENVKIATLFGGMPIIKLRETIAQTANLLQLQVCTCEEDAKTINDIAKRCKAGIDDISNIRKSYTKQLDERKKQIMAQERDLVAPLEYTLNRCKELHAAYIRECEARRAAAKALAQQRYAQQMAMAKEAIEAQERGEDITERINDIEEFANAQMPTELANALAPIQGVKTRTTWDYRVVELDRVPRKLLTIDHQAVKAEIQRLKKIGIAVEDVRIDGIEVFAKTTSVIS